MAYGRDAPGSCGFDTAAQATRIGTISARVHLSPSTFHSQLLVRTNLQAMLSGYRPACVLAGSYVHYCCRRATYAWCKFHSAISETATALHTFARAYGKDTSRSAWPGLLVARMVDILQSSRVHAKARSRSRGLCERSVSLLADTHRRRGLAIGRRECNAHRYGDVL